MDTDWIELGRINSKTTQTRAGLRDKAVEEYAEIIENGVDMDPIVVFDDGRDYYLAAGFHRREAYQRLGRAKVPCVVRKGSRWDAIEFGIRDNLRHRGERLTNADKRHNIEMVLREQPTWGDGKIAELCGATPKTVAKCRSQLESTREIPESTHRVGRDGRTLNTEKLGPSPSSSGFSAPDDARAPASTEHRCQCGSDWTSDGNGGRFCKDSGHAHPDNLEKYPEEDDAGGRQNEHGLTGENIAKMFNVIGEAITKCIREVGHLNYVLGSRNPWLDQSAKTIDRLLKESLVPWIRESLPKEYWGRLCSLLQDCLRSTRPDRADLPQDDLPF